MAVVIAILPLMVNKMDERNQTRENIAIAGQLMLAFAPARAFIQRNHETIPNGVRVFSGNDFVGTLESYGLPLGFMPVTPRGGRMSLIISRDGADILAVIAVSGVRLSRVRQAEVLARIGFWGIIHEDGILNGATGGWFLTETPNNVMFNPGDILMRVPDEDEFSELVARRARNPENNAFHTSLDMDNHNISNIGGLSVRTGRIAHIVARDFMLSGVNIDRRLRHEIDEVRTNRAVFSSHSGNPLVIQRADLTTTSLTAGSIGNHGIWPNLEVAGITARDFNMVQGRTSFVGPASWDVSGRATFTNITLNIDRLTVNSFLDASRGQDVFFDPDSGDINAPSSTGIRAGIIKTNNIVLRDQISADLMAGGTGHPIIEIRPSGVSVLPDVLIGTVNNDALRIPFLAEDESGRLETCRTIIGRTNIRYNNNSMAANIICQFAMYNRIERRLQVLQCLREGGSNCG